MPNEPLAAGWKAAIVVSLALNVVSLGVAVFRSGPPAPSAANARIDSLESRIRANQMQPTRSDGKPDDKGMGQ